MTLDVGHAVRKALEKLKKLEGIALETATKRLESDELERKMTAALKKQYPCWCGAPRCRGTLLAPRRGGRSSRLG